MTTSAYRPSMARYQAASRRARAATSPIEAMMRSVMAAVRVGLDPHQDPDGPAQAGGAERDERRVEDADVVVGEQRAAFGRDVLQTEEAHAEADPEQPGEPDTADRGPAVPLGAHRSKR